MPWASWEVSGNRVCTSLLFFFFFFFSLEGSLLSLSVHKKDSLAPTCYHSVESGDTAAEATIPNRCGPTGNLCIFVLVSLDQACK